MSDKFKNKYTIPSARLKGYDYSQNGMYFVTICTQRRDAPLGRLYNFGEIENGKMQLSEIGKIIQEELLKTPVIRSNVILDEWIIMPNHLHMIIEIINQPNGVETPRRGVSTMSKRNGYNSNWKPNSLGSIINQFKSICTKRIWKSGLHIFQWQSRFYDHIICNEISLNKIREYIKINPKMWERDRNNLENLWI